MVAFITSGSAVYKAGANMALTIPEAAWTEWISGSMSTINCVARNNWSDSFATLNDDVKNILVDISSSLVAINAIQFDMSGYTSRIEAEDMVNIQRDTALRGLSIIRGQKVVDFINGS